jgi:transposase-like protein
VPRTRPPYPPQFRVEAVRLVRVGGREIRSVAEELGVSQQTLRNWIKQAQLDDGQRDDGLTTAEREELRQLRRVLGVSHAGYYAFGRRLSSHRLVLDLALTERIRQLHERSRGTYGAPRIHADLRDFDGLRVGRKRVARLMRAAGLVGCHRRRRVGLTRRDPAARPAPDLVQRHGWHPRASEAGWDRHSGSSAQSRKRRRASSRWEAPHSRVGPSCTGRRVR